MIWFTALVGVLMVGGSLGRSLSQGSDVTGLDKTSPESSAMKYYITGNRDEEGHWTEQVKIEHGDEDWHVDVDHATLEEELGHPKVKITASFSAAKPSTRSVKGGVAVKEEVEPKKDKGWVYKLYPKSHLDWFGAEVKCEEWGGHLAIPDTREKMTELTRILQEHVKDSETYDNTAVYLGFTDIKEEGNFVTVLGKPLFHSHDSAWSPSWYRSDQPDDDKSWSKDGEDCGSLRASGGLNDIPCRYSLPFICERERGIEDTVDEEETTTSAENGNEDKDSLQLFPHADKNWYEARKACVEWGGHLAIPDSEEKMMKMMKMMLNSPVKNPDWFGAFLGFNDIKKEGEFVTIFGKPVFNSNGQWSPHWYKSNEPDDYKGWTTEGEDCGSMRSNGGLNDVPCRYHLPYFCEKSSEIDNPQEPGDDYEFQRSLSLYRTDKDYELLYWPEDMEDDNKDDDDGGTLRLFPQTDHDWFMANDACKLWGGFLAVPDTREKVEAMSLKMKVARIEAAFLGFEDQEKEGYFVTISGAPLFNSSSWSPGWFRPDQPDDDKEWTKDGEDCGSIRFGGGLNDVPCKYHLPFFCQKSTPLEEEEPTDEDDAMTTETPSQATSEHLLELFNIEITTLKTTLDDDSHVVESDEQSSSKEQAVLVEDSPEDSYEAVKPKTPDVRGVMEAKTDTGDVFQLFPATLLSWSGAQVKCEEWGGHLAIPDTREKLTELTRILQEHIKETGVTTEAFLGFNDINEEGNFVNIFGEPLFHSQDSAWSPPWYRSDQPDDAKSWSEVGEDCGSLKSSGGLNDVPCQWGLPFICERERGIEDVVDKEESSNSAESGDEDKDVLQLQTTLDDDSHHVETEEKSAVEDEALQTDTSSPATLEDDLEIDEQSSSKEQAVQVDLTLDDDSPKGSYEGQSTRQPWVSPRYG